jgi:hypothetical protein
MRSKSPESRGLGGLGLGFASCWFGRSDLPRGKATPGNSEDELLGLGLEKQRLDNPKMNQVRLMFFTLF